MRFLSISVLLFAGCTRQIYEPLDTAETGDSDADTDADTDSDTDSDTDADTDADGDPNCHPYEPISYANWQKHFTVNYKGSAGTEDQKGFGSFGNSFAVKTTLSASGGGGWDGNSFFDCDSGGAYVDRFEGTFTTPSDGVDHAVTATDNPHRKFLPAPSAISDVNATWHYSYSYDITSSDSGAGTLAIATVGDYTNYGFEDNVDVGMPCPSSASCGTGANAGKWNDVLWIHNVYTQTPSQDLIDNGFTAVTAQQDVYYAEGIGLIKEVTVDDATQEVIISKDLATASGF